MDSFVVIGYGRLGKTIIRSYPDRVAGVVTRVGGRDLDLLDTESIDLESISELERVDTCWLAVPDSEVPALARRLSVLRLPPQLSLLVHSSGVLGNQVLHEVAERGVMTAALHPNLILTGSSEFPPSTLWGLSSDSADRRRISRLVDHGIDQIVQIPDEYRPLYHAAATLVANYPLLLAESSRQLYRASGIDEAVGRQLISGYLRSALDLVSGTQEQTSLLSDLTGPVARRDTSTIALHEEAVRRFGMEGTANLLHELAEATRQALAKREEGGG